MTSTAEPLYGLAHGVGLYFAPLGAFLRHFPFGDDRQIPAEELPFVRRAALGGTALATPFLQDLVKRGFLQPFSTHPDPVYVRLIEKHDRMFSWWLDLAPEWCRPVHRLLIDAHAARKVYHVDLGQCPALPETVVRRVLLAGAPPKKVLLVGDDDLQALAFASRGHEVTVLDLDDMLLERLARLAEQHQLPMQLRHQDLRLPLPPELVGAFDLFVADPVSSVGMLELFLTRGLACLKPDGRALVAVAHPAESMLQDLVRRTGLEVQRYHRDFNHYYMPHTSPSGYLSDAYELSPGPQLRLPTAPDEECIVRDLVEGEASWQLRSAHRLFVHDIETRYATVAHLERLFQMLQTEGLFVVRDAAYYQTYDSVVYTVIGDNASFITAAIHRKAAFLELTAAPYDERVLHRLHALLIMAFKKDFTRIETIRTRGSIEARVR